MSRRRENNPIPAQHRTCFQDRHRLVKFLATLLGIALVCFCYWHLHRPISYPPGVLVADEPMQIGLPADTPPFAHGKFRLKPLAVFSIDARVLHSKSYRYDTQAALVPLDLALGWGPMSDQSVLDQLTITQSARFFWYEYQRPPIPKEEIISHSTNIHVIAATKTNRDPVQIASHRRARAFERRPGRGQRPWASFLAEFAQPHR